MNDAIGSNQKRDRSWAYAKIMRWSKLCGFVAKIPDQPKEPVTTTSNASRYFLSIDNEILKLLKNIARCGNHFPGWSEVWRNIRSTIIESEGKSRGYWLFYLVQRYFCLWIYISRNIAVRTLYLPNSQSIQLAHCRLWLSSACSVLTNLIKIAILFQVWAEASNLATPRYTMAWWGAALFIGVA